MEVPFEVYVPVPSDGRDQYRITGQADGYKTRTVDVYVTPQDDYIWVNVILYPSLSRSKTIIYHEWLISLLKTFFRI